MGSQGRGEVSLAVEAGAETPVVVQDAKVLTVGHKGRGEPFIRWGWGRAEVSPIARSGRETRNVSTLRSAGKGSMPVSDSGRLIQPLSKRVVQDA